MNLDIPTAGCDSRSGPSHEFKIPALPIPLSEIKGDVTAVRTFQPQALAVRPSLRSPHLGGLGRRCPG